MRGDSIVVEEHHRKAAKGIAKVVIPLIRSGGTRYIITVAGESGAGKSEVATALAEQLEADGSRVVILQQDDYFVYPPKTNDATRRRDISWVGPQEVHLDTMDEHLNAFRAGETSIEKPLVIYAEDRITVETLDVKDANVLIAEGTYTTQLENVDTHVFIDRNFKDTKKHRERRIRHASELDSFIDRVLQIEHKIISANKPKADVIVNKDYSVAMTV